MKISIVICTYNGAKFLGEQLDSIVSQSLSPYEVIAQDDGSSDGTWNILLEYAERYPYILRYIRILKKEVLIIISSVPSNGLQAT